MVGLNRAAPGHETIIEERYTHASPSRGAATAAPCTPCVFHDPARLDGFFL